MYHSVTFTLHTTSSQRNRVVLYNQVGFTLGNISAGMDGGSSGRRGRSVEGGSRLLISLTGASDSPKEE